MNITPLADNFTLALFGNLGWPEILIIVFLGLIIFGKRLPDIGKSLGKGIVSFKKGLQGVKDDIEDSVNREDDDVDEPKRIEPSSTKTEHTAAPKNKAHA